MREDWIECTFGEFIYFKNGFAFKSLDYIEDGIPIIRIGDISQNQINIEDSKRVKESNDLDEYLIKKGDILIAMSGATTGKFGMYNLDSKAYLNQRVGNIFPISSELVYKPFLFFLLHFLKRQIEKDAYGGAQPNISSKKIEEMKVPFIPLPEQRAIVKKIETLFSSLDAGISDLKKAQEQLKIYRQAVLKKAFEGELTKGWREKQTDLPSAEELKKEVKDRLIENGIKTKFSEIESSNYNLPVQWVSVRNESLLFYVTSGSRDWKKYYADKGSIFVRTQNINKNFLDLTDVAYVDLPIKVEGKRSLIEKNDLLMTITGANVGKTAVIDKEISEAYVSQSVALLKYFPSIFTKMYSYFFQSESHGKKAIANLVYGVGRPVLSLENMREVEVLYCSYEEQIQIVKEIEARLSVCDAVEKQIQDSLNQAEALRQSILKKAFEGTLVTAEEIEACKLEPDYEPASVLLEKIKTEKEAGDKRKKNIKEKPKKKMEKKEILQLLAENNNEMIADQLWKNSIYSEDIDAFYLKLRELAEQGKILELKDGKKVYIKLI